VAFFVTVDVSDLRLECNLVSTDLTTTSALAVNFSDLLLGVRDGDFERLRPRGGLLDFVWLLAGDLDLVLLRTSYSTHHNNYYYGMSDHHISTVHLSLKIQSINILQRKTPNVTPVN